MNFETIMEQIAVQVRHDIDYFNKHGVKSPNLAKAQAMLKMDNEDFAKACKGL